MSLFAWLRPPGPSLNPAQQLAVQRLQGPAPLGDCSLRQQRWVVLDLETTGLNVNRDLLLSIGAVVIEDGAIDLSQQFECTLRRSGHKPGPSVLLHGLGPGAIAAGCEPADGLLDFMEFLGDSPVLAFHAPFDQRMLGRALKDCVGYRLQHTFIDVAELAPLLNPQTVLREASLDDWVGHFGLQADERHNASADAYVTAQLALILLSQARRLGLDSPALLMERLNQWRRRQRMPSL
ncbi:exonuclease domain-containing protein [Pseudomonas sp.]|uniref:3'-5' exonuclease n=1 Tax=Pseudomonas sp. TaxID=306 RepID=UPI002587AA22|nr:exonuclease domain-containing protein [Pseudomonas sp.]